MSWVHPLQQQRGQTANGPSSAAAAASRSASGAGLTTTAPDVTATVRATATTVDSNEVWNTFLQGLNAPLPLPSSLPPSTLTSASASQRNDDPATFFSSSAANCSRTTPGCDLLSASSLSLPLTLSARDQQHLDAWSNTIFSDFSSGATVSVTPPVPVPVPLASTDSRVGLGDIQVAVTGDDYASPNAGGGEAFDWHWQKLYDGWRGEEGLTAVTASTPIAVSSVSPSASALASGSGLGYPSAATASAPRRKSTLAATALDTPPATTTASGSVSAEDVEGDLEEDRRRRNTAASARFRQKKKLRDQQLIRDTVELRETVDALEDEKSALSAENEWLRDLVRARAESARLKLNEQG